MQIYDYREVGTTWPTKPLLVFLCNKKQQSKTRADGNSRTPEVDRKAPHHITNRRESRGQQYTSSNYNEYWTTIKNQMGQGEEVKVHSEPEIQIQERGEIFFFYRPKVNMEEARSSEDVQRLYMVLRPESGERPVEQKQSPDSVKEGSKAAAEAELASHSVHQGEGGGRGVQEVNIEKEALFRLMVIGKKSLPDPHQKGTPYWGFVEMVTAKIDDIRAALQGEEYDTSTRGRRHKAPSRAVGEGIYQQPQQGGGGYRGIQNKRKAVFPAHLQGLFGNKRFCPADPPDLLNYEGCEFLLISASDDIEEELGLELKSTKQKEGQKQGEEPANDDDQEDPFCSSSSSDLVKTFGEDAAPTSPLFEGTWA
ncbi:hypothetical protein Ancab_004401 [Ancistrocladus abbreviatus]